MFTVFDLPVGGSVMDCKKMFATTGKLGEELSYCLHVAIL